MNSQLQRLESYPADISGAASDDALIAMWLSGRPANTRRAYTKDVERFRCHVGKSLQHVTARDLIDYAESLARLKTSSQHRRLSSVKSLYSYAMALGYVRLDPAAALRLPKPVDNRASKLLSLEAVKAIIKATSGRDRLICRTLYLAGIREAELIALQASDVNQTTTGYSLTVTGKGDKLRHIAILPALAVDLVAHRESGVLFRSVRDNPLSASDIYRIVRIAGERAGYRATPHLLRHAHASHALDNGAPLPLVRDSLGHGSIATTSVYVHARPSDGAGLYLDQDDQEHMPA